MFRIVFDCNSSRFIVQITKWKLFWRTCINQVDGNSMKFETYADARRWVNSVGLNMALIEQSARKLCGGLQNIPTESTQTDSVEWRLLNMFKNYPL